MINKVGYADNRTSFGAYFKQNELLYKLYNATTGVSLMEARMERTLPLAQEFRYKTPDHELEITRLIEGTTQSVSVRNNSTGAYATFETKEGLHEVLPYMLENLNKWAKSKTRFWREDVQASRIYRLLTGQKDSAAVKI